MIDDIIGFGMIYIPATIVITGDWYQILDIDKNCVICRKCYINHPLSFF